MALRAPRWRTPPPSASPEPAQVLVPSARAPLACAFGGGGPFGIAYAFGIADVLVAAGAPLAGASMLGTSAGSWVSACLATGVPFSALCELPPLRVPNLRAGAVQRLAASVLGDSHSSQVRAVAVRVSSGRRVLLDGGEHRLADIVAASSAVPWLFAPARIDGHRYVDGGVRSLVSAQRATSAEHLLVIAPIAGPMFGPAGQTMEVLLRREIRKWQETTGGKAHLVRPNRAIADLARRPLDLFDSDLARSVYPLAQEQARHLLATRPGMAELGQVGRSNAA